MSWDVENIHGFFKVLGVGRVENIDFSLIFNGAEGGEATDKQKKIY